MKFCEITVYTTNAVLNYNVKVTTENFAETLAASLEEGTVILETDDENILLLCTVNVVAVEIGQEFSVKAPPR